MSNSFPPLPRILFFGTPEIAVPTLRKLKHSGLCEVVGVVTQPDKPSGRGQKLRPSPVKQAAEELGLAVFQPTALKGISQTGDGLEFTSLKPPSTPSAEFVQYLNQAGPFDCFIVVAYGKIIPPSLIELPKRGIINIHLSLLPRWRGAAPIQRAILAGDLSTGVSIMQIDAGLDTGPVCAQKPVEILPSDTAASLAVKLAELGAELMLVVLPEIVAGTAVFKGQSETGVTYAEKFERADSVIDWCDEIVVTERRIRACAPVPGARSMLDGEEVKLFSANALMSRILPKGAPGEVVVVNDKELIVAGGEGEYLSILEMQLPGRKRLPIAALLAGRPIPVGSRFVALG